ncbi:TPA: hypothetical protein L9S60_005247 [Klebsiella pneumoniae]|uniref:hypothetical protein n=1 Tax=Klebsiella quasipneumoniae TaxID=1463165 RepID=UPI002998DAB3|nr:hypothetical protein [Klebsiella quasipneumoniae]HBR3485226.1 hypothetical protein [Klebsiella pneumoniae]
MNNENTPFIPYENVPFKGSDRVIVIALDDKKNIRHIQQLKDYLEKPSIRMAMSTHGASLLDVLTKEDYLTMTQSGEPGLKFMSTGNHHGDATKLLGSIAEALIVQECNNNSDFNRDLARHARGSSKLSEIPDGYIAIATGSYQTKLHHNTHYNPNDTQRDIIWVDKDDTELQLDSMLPTKNKNSVKPAGLQIKASYDYRNVLRNIEKYAYPVVYFDMNDDWDDLHAAVSNLNRNDMANAITLIKPDAVLHYTKERLKNYHQIIVALLKGECTMKQLIEEANILNDSALGSVLDNAAEDSGDKVILPIQKDWLQQALEQVAESNRKLADNLFT